MPSRRTNRTTTTTTRRTSTRNVKEVSNMKSSKPNDRELIRDRVLSLLSSNKNVWSGTMTDLATNLRGNLSDRKSLLVPSRLGAVVRETLGMLRARGVSIKFFRQGRESSKMVKFTRKSV